MVSTQNNHLSRKKNRPLNAEFLLQYLTHLADQNNIKTWCLAYSGGVDSQVLLHLLNLTKLPVSAVYIDHGLQAQSVDWAEHCRQQCHSLNIPFQVIRVNATPVQGESPEAVARSARYTALKTCIKKAACLLTAQHQDDQSETILLQLLRGAGAAGLAGMPEITVFSEGWHARPLLTFSQDAVLAYAKLNQLNWVEDPSNQQLNYDRNYLRHEVIPQVQQRWPAVNKTLLSFSQQQAENAQLLEVLAQQDLSTCLLSDESLDINLLNEMTDARLRNTLRFWLKSSQTPVPSRAVLGQIVQQIKNTSGDSSVLVSWAKSEVRRFKDRLFCLQQIQHDASQVFTCEMNKTLSIASLNKQFVFKKISSDDSVKFVLNADVLIQPLTLCFRQGGEKIKPAGRNGSHNLKSLFQEAQVPSWQRERIPLLFMGDELIAVVGYWLADAYAIKGEGVLPVLG